MSLLFNDFTAMLCIFRLLVTVVLIPHRLYFATTIKLDISTVKTSSANIMFHNTLSLKFVNLTDACLTSQKHLPIFGNRVKDRVQTLIYLRVGGSLS